MAHDKMLGAVRPSKPLPRTEMRAVLTVAHHATDAADCAELLAMLGLIEPSDALRQDRLCPTTLAHRALEAQRSARRSGRVSEGSDGDG